MTDRQLIELGAKEIAARQGFADWREMRQRDLEYLCARIEERSGILISLSTIKRILNGEYNRLPQVATLNALSVYLGYADWQGFKAAHASAGGRVRPVAEGAPRVGRALNRRFSQILIGSGIVVVLVAVIASRNFITPKAGGTATFSFRKTTANAIPNTVVFTYDIDGLKGDSFFIQQSWDRNRRVRIFKNSHTLTDIYFEPGYHVAKLYANDRIVKTVDVSIPTDKWFFYSKESITRGLPAYIHTDSPFHRGILGLDRETLVANKIDPEKPGVYLYTFFPSGIGADADNFHLEANIKMTDVRNTACPWIMTEVYCQHGFMYCMYTIPGCTGNIRAQFGDQVIDGRANDLSALGFDVHQWHHLSLTVKHRQVTVSVDGKVCLAQGYIAPAGMITGMGFHSNGLCQIDSIRLAGLD